MVRSHSSSIQIEGKLRFDLLIQSRIVQLYLVAAFLPSIAQQTLLIGFDRSQMGRWILSIMEPILDEF